MEENLVTEVKIVTQDDDVADKNTNETEKKPRKKMSKKRKKN